MTPTIDGRPARVAVVSEWLPPASKSGAAWANEQLAIQLAARGWQVTEVSQTPRAPDAPYDSIVVPGSARLGYLSFARGLRRVDWSPYDLVISTGADFLMPKRSGTTWVRLFNGSAFDEVRHATDAGFRNRMMAAAAFDTVSMLRADERAAISKNTVRWHPMVRHVIPVGVDRTVFTPGPERDRPTVLFVGSLGGRKRGALLRELFHDVVRRRVPDAQLVLVLVEKDVTPREGEEIHHFVDQAELAELYRSAWVYASLSTYEGFGVPYIEALASGTPVVSVPNLGAKELLPIGSGGLLAETTGVPSVLIGLLTDADRRARLGELGRDHSSRFGWDAVSQAYAALAGAAPHPT